MSGAHQIGAIERQNEIEDQIAVLAGVLQPCWDLDQGCAARLPPHRDRF